MAVTAAVLLVGLSSNATAQAGRQAPAKPPAPPRQQKPRSTAPPIPGPERIRIVVNGGLQLATGSFGQNFTLTKNVESTPVTTDLSVAAGGFLDAGARIRVSRTLTIGAVGFLGVSSTNGTLGAQVPNPFYFSQLRPVSGELSRLTHIERGAHVELAYPISIKKGREITVFGGPSIINLKQELVTDFRYDETYSYDTATFNSASTTEVSKTGFGANVGADVTWRLSRSIRGGALVRYTFASLSLSPASGNTATVHAGGLQVAGGVRILLQKAPPKPARPARPARAKRP